METSRIAQILDEMGTLLEVRGENPFRCRAYHNAAQALKGMPADLSEMIADGSLAESAGDRILQSQARRLVAPIFAAIRDHPQVLRAEVCGSLRRRAETIGDLDILFSARDAAPVLERFVTLPEVATVLAHGPTKASVRLAEGVQCDLRGVEDAQFPFALHYFTGSKAHNIAMRRRALARGYTLNEYALEGPDGPVECRTEADLFAALGLADIPPELREDGGEFEL